MSNLRSRENVAKQLWDWEWLKPAFTPTRARPCDIDGIIEQCNHLLVIEAKPIGYVWNQDDAQFRTLRTLSRKPGVSVMVLYGERPDDPIVHQVELVWPIKTPRQRSNTSNTVVVGWVQRWWQHSRSGCGGDCDLASWLGSSDLPPKYLTTL